MNVNTIRIPKGNQGTSPFYITPNTLDMAEAYGLKVIMGFAFDEGMDFEKLSMREAVKEEFETYIQNFKNQTEREPD